MRILIIKLRHFGDVLLTTPVINTLKAHYPDAVIDFLAYRPTESMLTGNPAIHHCYTIDRTLKHQGLWRQLRGEWCLWKKLKHQRYDLIINLADQWRAGFYCLSLAPQQSLGLAFAHRNFWLWRFFHTSLASTDLFNQQHAVINNLQILTPLNLPSWVEKVSLYYSSADIATIAAYLSSTKQPPVVIQPTARWVFKTWEKDDFIKVIDDLTANHQHVVLTGGPAKEEQTMVDAIYAGCQRHEQITNLAGKLTIQQLAALLSQAKLFIGVDSMAMHMAAALKRPSVVLFGPSNVQQWYPWQTDYQLLWAGDYSPLPSVNEVDTDTKERYLAAIPYQAVIEAVHRYLK